MDHYIVLDYELTYKLADGFDYSGYGEVLGTIRLSSAILQYTLTGLQPYRGYFIKLRARVLRAYDSSGSGNSLDLSSGVDMVNNRSRSGSGMKPVDTDSESEGLLGSGDVIGPDDDVTDGVITHINITSPEGARLSCIVLRLPLLSLFFSVSLQCISNQSTC